MWESNPRPLNLQPAAELPPQGLIARTILTYMANLNGHELRVGFTCCTRSANYGAFGGGYSTKQKPQGVFLCRSSPIMTILTSPHMENSS